MAANRFALEKHIFEPDGERLVKAIHVSQLEKKRKTYFLCASVSRERSGFVSLVKKVDKDVFKRKNTWPLKDLQLVDGKDGKRDTAGLNLQFDKIYRWIASTPLERNMFIANLWTLCSQQNQQQPRAMAPEFVNIPAELLESGAAPTSDVQTALSPVSGSPSEGDNYKALAGQEEADLLKMMSECDLAIEDAESFSNALAQDLSVLDGANVQSIMASEQQVDSLIAVVQRAIDEIGAVERRLDAYDTALVAVRRSLREMDREKSKLELTHRNQKRLLQTLDNILPELTHRQRQVLTEPELTSAAGLREACDAAQVLSRSAAASLSRDADLQLMAAAGEQRRLHEKLRTRFSNAVLRQMSNLFVHMGNDVGSIGDDLQLPDHSARHLKLQPYSELVHWTKAVDHKSYEALRKVYEDALSQRYDREIKALFSAACIQTGANSRRESIVDSPVTGSGGAGGSSATLSRVPSQIRQQLQSKPSISAANQTQAHTALLANHSHAWTKMDASLRGRFDAVLVRVLRGLEPTCQREHVFCTDFFQLITDNAQSDKVSTASGTISVGAAGSDVDSLGSARSHSEPLRQMMLSLFGSLQTELNSFLALHERIDSFCTMHVLVRVSEHVAPSITPGNSSAGSATASTGFLHQTFAGALLASKQSLDRLMYAQIESVQSYPVARHAGRCGVLPFVDNFQELVKLAESVFRDSPRHADWLRWCVRLLHALVEQITVIGNQHPKTPLQVVQMENFHHLHAVLMRLKLSGLESERRDLKIKYSDALQAYVARYFGQPLSKLNRFFEGVQLRVQQGVRESEVGYQLAFSKQELRKLIREYPGREVKRGLETLYRKVEKHLCDEENLLQVVWRAMQEEFLAQYKMLEEMIQRCYPGAMLCLEFTIGDLLGYFSDIAQQH